VKKVNQWQKWPVSTYSFEWNSTFWSKWIDNSIWSGDNIIDVEEGYWRHSKNSSTLIECPNSGACLGSYNLNGDYPVYCSTGYKGILCAEWDNTKGDKYWLSLNFKWNKWHTSFLNVLKFLGSWILWLVYIFILVYVNMRRKESWQLSTLFKIFTDYIHFTLIAIYYNTRIPGSFLNTFLVIGRISHPDESFLSFDWLFAHQNVKSFAPSNALFKIFLYAILPIILILFIILTLWIVSFILETFHSSKTFNLQKSIYLSIMCVFYLLYPVLTMKGISVFLWSKVDENDYRMTNNLEYGWYSSDHIIWIILLGIPIIAIWIIGIPSLWVILSIRRSALEDWKIRKYLEMINKGFKNSKYYWGWVSSIFKFLLVLFHALTHTISSNYQIFGSIGKRLFCINYIVILMIYYRIQYRNLPFKLGENNEIDLFSIEVAILTVSSGLIFNWREELHRFFSNFILFLLFLTHIIFLIKWIFFACVALEWKNIHFQRALKVYSIIVRKNYQISIFSTKTTVVKEDTSMKDKSIRSRNRKRKRIAKNVIKV